MGFLDRFRKPQDPPELDPLKDLVLAKLKVGYLVDYDLRTWQVTDYARYRFNDGRESEEWELTAERDKRYLELASDDADVWTLSEDIPVGALGGGVRQHILDHDDPPEQVTYQGRVYYSEGSNGGQLIPGGGGPRRDLIQWELLDESEEHFLSIMQWSETEVTAVAGIFVEDYQFSDILPGEPE
ncbi:MAG: DUF4178 domain-containing protein [Acidobacteriota bacterium]